MRLVPDLEFRHVSRPMSPEEIEDLLMRGFVVLGQMIVVKQAGGVATMDNPDGKAEHVPATVWVANPFAMPAGHVAQVLLDSESKDDLCATLFDMTLEELEDALEKQKNERHE